jgi:hypothetical protein
VGERREELKREGGEGKRGEGGERDKEKGGGREIDRDAERRRNRETGRGDKRHRERTDIQAEGAIKGLPIMGELSITKQKHFPMGGNLGGPKQGKQGK